MSVQKMNPEVKAKWVAALRSGEYEQGVGFLRASDDKFCCLGVLCEIAVAENVIPSPTADSRNWLYDERGLFPSETVQQWAGVSRYGELPDGNRLSDYNDEDGKTFAEIADIIEEQL